MSFVDSAIVSVRAGKGGDGALSFRQEKYVDKGGPDGGDGGKGGSIIFVADRNANTLVDFRYKQELKADDGQPGSKRRRHGKSGQHLRVAVPVGTVVKRQETGDVLVDLLEDSAEAVVARGGSGGFGNAHFVSSTRQAPRVAEIGEQGESLTLELELKLLADIGLVGLPNAGKSTFLGAVTHARPEVADYAFTTLIPHLGVARVDETDLLISDIPGLIEGASEGKGLGDAFLRHIERTSVLLHLIDAYQNDVAAAYATIMRELAAFNPELAERPRVVALTKCEGLDDEIIAMQRQALGSLLPLGTPFFAVSAHTGFNIQPLLRELARQVAAVRTAEQEKEAVARDEGMVISLAPEQHKEAWRVRREENHFIVTGEKIERFAARTDFSNVHGVVRLRDIMRKMGIMHELARAGAEPDDVVQIGESGRCRLSFEEQR